MASKIKAALEKISKTTPEEETEKKSQEVDEKIKSILEQVERLQNNGIFRYELLVQLSEINGNLKKFNELLQNEIKN